MSTRVVIIRLTSCLPTRASVQPPFTVARYLALSLSRSLSRASPTTMYQYWLRSDLAPVWSSGADARKPSTDATEPGAALSAAGGASLGPPPPAPTPGLLASTRFRAARSALLAGAPYLDSSSFSVCRWIFPASMPRSMAWIKPLRHRAQWGRVNRCQRKEVKYGGLVDQKGSAVKGVVRLRTSSSASVMSHPGSI